ncbi:MAG: hypothetical protein NT154_25025, partial [Verrucomicrobia bacterium]|nr:hypothetical protein [Verrucomicrobiota bacterium]
RPTMPEPSAGSATADQSRRHSMVFVRPSIGSVSRESVNAAGHLARVVATECIPVFMNPVGDPGRA